jgi:hypothetical protein
LACGFGLRKHRDRRIIASVNIDFFELIPQLAAIGTGKLNKYFQRFRFEFDPHQTQRLVQA